MAKINLDKYYTPKEIAWKCILKTVDVIGTGKILEAIEPSAGNGAFSSLIERCIAYDIEPENDNIIKQDFLQLELPYKKGRIFIGNPPFGSKNTLAVQFYKKCVKMGDYIAFILPINCLNNTNQMYEFDLIHSEDLGKINYSGVEVHCCFNIYKRPEHGLNKKQNTKLKTVTITHTKKYRCSDDCLQSGCPTHEAKLIYQSVSDAYTFENGKGETKYFERGELEAFIELLKGLDRADAVQV